MNKVVLVGRLTRDPEVRYSQGDNATAVARYTLAVDRRFRRDGEPTADFIPCVIFGRSWKSRSLQRAEQRQKPTEQVSSVSLHRVRHLAQMQVMAS